MSGHAVWLRPRAAAVLLLSLSSLAWQMNVSGWFCIFSVLLVPGRLQQNSLGALSCRRFRCLLPIQGLPEAPLGLVVVVAGLRGANQGFQGVLEPVVMRVVELLGQPLLGVHGVAAPGECYGRGAPGRGLSLVSGSR